MKLLNKLAKPAKIIITKKTKQKEVQELQKIWEATKQRLKKSKSKQDQDFAKFLENNYINSTTGLITSKIKWNSREVSCGSKEIRV